MEPCGLNYRKASLRAKYNGAIGSKEERPKSTLPYGGWQRTSHGVLAENPLSVHAGPFATN